MNREEARNALCEECTGTAKERANYIAQGHHTYITRRGVQALAVLAEAYLSLSFVGQCFGHAVWSDCPPEQVHKIMPALRPGSAPSPRYSFKHNGLKGRYEIHDNECNIIVATAYFEATAKRIADMLNKGVK